MTNLKEWYGISITDPLFDENLEGKLKKLQLEIHALQNNITNQYWKTPEVIARVVIDKLDDYEPLIPAFEMISKYCKPMLQICDSYLDGKLDDDEYNARELWFLENLSEYSPFVEIANEIGPTNNWSSKSQIGRVNKSSSLWIGHERISTVFWPGREYIPICLDEWLGEFGPECEHVLMSFYPNTLMDFESLSSYIGGDIAGLSECGMNEWVGPYSHKMEALVKRRAYQIGAPVCWWNWQGEAKY